MAIYTRSNYSVLDTKALDAKTYYNSLSDYNADPYKYNGQIAYIEDAVEYYQAPGANPGDDDVCGVSDSLRLNLPGTNKYLDFFYITGSEAHPTGINVYGPLTQTSMYNYNFMTFSFDLLGSLPNYINIGTNGWSPFIDMTDIDYCQTNYSSTGISIYENNSVPSVSLNINGLNIGYSNTESGVPALIGTGLIPSADQNNALIVGKYNDDTNPYLFSVGCGTDNTHRRNVLAVDSDGYTMIDDLTVNSMMSNNGILANSIIDLDYLNKNIGIYLEGTDASQSSSASSSNDFKLFYGTYITGFKLRLIQAYKSTAKLNIFLYTNTTTKTPTEYILQNYPIGNLSVGDVVIEDMLIIGSANTYIGLSITGADNTGKAKGLLQYCQSW